MNTLRLSAALAALPLLLAASGCCSLARLFCGPDTSAWLPIDYATPAMRENSEPTGSCISSPTSRMPLPSA